MFLCQKTYATDILERVDMRTCHSHRTPVDTDTKLRVDGTPVSDPTLYRSLAGAFQYLTFTYPDLSYVVQQICLHMHDLREPHLASLKRILRYVQDQDAASQVRVLHVPSRYRYAYVFTKGLLFALFDGFKTILNVQHYLAPTAKSC
ncbi:ribonuclease H-like domain-containing protein [Tanacetum coccineum]